MPRFIKFIISSCTPTNTNAVCVEALKALGFKDKIIKKCWKIFMTMNQSGSEKISFIEFTEYFSLDYGHPFVIKCFSCFDINGGGDVDFLEFMLSVWNICAISSETLIKFTFNMYDSNSNGTLNNQEMKDMIKEFYGNNYEQSSLAMNCLRNLMETSEYQGGVIDLEDFKGYAVNHSMLLFPMFQLQQKIQNQVMGMKYWENEFKKSNKLSSFSRKKCALIDSSRLPALLQAYRIGGSNAILSLAHDLAGS